MVTFSVRRFEKESSSFGTDKEIRGVIENFAILLVQNSFRPNYKKIYRTLYAKISTRHFIDKVGRKFDSKLIGTFIKAFH